MINVFDVTDFGAVGDGATDCTAAIQAALDAAARVEGTVVVPPGKYLTGRLTMGKRTRLQGYAGWNYRGDGLSTLILNDPGAPCLLDITGAFGCTVCGVCMNGQELGRGVHGIYLHWERYNGGAEEDTPTIEDCRIGRFSGNGVHLDHVWCFSLRHSMLHRNLGCGLYVDGWDAFVLDNWFSGNHGGGMVGGAVAESITVTGNRVEWNRVGGFCLKNGRSVNITGNFFDRSFGPGLTLGEGGCFHDCTVNGNVFRRSGSPDDLPLPSPYHSCHVYLTNARNITLSANTFEWGRNDRGQGTLSPAYNLVISRSTHLIVQGNAMHQGATGGNIVYDGQGNNVIKENLSQFPEEITPFSPLGQ